MTAEPHVDPAPAQRRAGSWIGRTVAILIAAGFVGLLVYGVLARSPDTTIDDSLAKSEPIAAPSFEMAVLQRGDLGPILSRRLRPALADGRVALSELRGIPVVLNFWASWCVPCREEAPGLERTWRLARRSGVLFLGLDEQDISDDARSFLRVFHIDYLNIREPTNSVGRRYGVTGFPETFFISPAGRIVGHVIRVADEAKLRAGIQAARAGGVIAAERGGAQSSAK